MGGNILVTFLGTSSAPPQINRRQSSCMIQYRGHKILIDVGEAIQLQMIKHKIKFRGPLTILLTHLHSDHTLGLIGLLSTRCFYGIDSPVRIIGPTWTSSFVFLQLLAYRFIPDYNIEVIETEGGVVENNTDFFIESFPVNHVNQCVGYKFVTHTPLGKFSTERAEKLKIPKVMWNTLQKGTPVEINGKKIYPSDILLDTNVKPKKIIITGDTTLTDTVINNSSEADMLIHDATYPPEEVERAKKYKHCTSSEAAFVAKKARVKKLYLTHISNIHKDLDYSLKEAKTIFSESYFAYDGLNIELPSHNF